ncbi:MAG: hypothetical protein HQ488_03315 [Parcubacteria group bacterium]|nr:hypothetical protein [Parcubacteria group bacterium]
MKTFLLLSLAILLTPLSAVLADEVGPEMSAVSPLSATYDVPSTFSVTATDVDGVTSCLLVISSTYETPMSYNADTDVWEVVYTFTTFRSANSIRAKCTDGAGNELLGPSKIISVAEAPIETTDGDSSTDPEASEVDATDWTASEVTAVSPVLIKTACPGGEDFTHTCRTVYFLDNLGYRHAFPNERVFFSWYEGYDDLHIVSTDVMSDFPLGSNVTYHPGTLMVKFPTMNTVYVVEQHSLLRAVTSEDIAIDLYGEDWNQMIHDISDVFYGNYTYGTHIESANDFDVAAQTASVQSINDNL